MKIEDRIYGAEVVNEGILEDLINSPSVQRLKDISQLGMPDEYSKFKGFSRYEHSIGVMVLLRRLYAGLEEQVAGLLHDVSHTPFSHVIDWVFGDPSKEDYQDKVHKSFLKDSEIPLILKKHHFDLDKVSDYSHFKLLERELPGLCADRLDYSIRQIGRGKNREIARQILNKLSVKDNQIVFLDENEAKIFGEKYMKLQKEQWAGDDMRSRYYIFSEVLKRAFDKNLISLGDLKKTEEPLLKILKDSQEEFIKERLNLLKNGFEVVPDELGIELKKKFRYVDPEVLINGSYLPLSRLSKEYSDLINQEKERSNEIKKIKIVPH